MPQADLYFTKDRTLPASVLAEIEGAIAAFDTAAGVCKGRLHPVDGHHSHVFLRLSLLPKPHRDAAYAAELGKKLAEVIRPHVAAPSALAVNISFDLVHYTAVTVE
ncbi:hypothetical protein [Falsirhodobacter xinxiangensis]|uniref:hypothetical protein n=1 Tax=Falsirhodobacter xinxiangensis TaxID=2530049 RepID=UPI0010AA0B7B|nr:hypothetical protein [Rhodobacter xinxiangensis]